MKKANKKNEVIKKDSVLSESEMLARVNFSNEEDIRQKAAEIYNLR